MSDLCALNLVCITAASKTSPARNKRAISMRNSKYKHADYTQFKYRIYTTYIYKYQFMYIFKNTKRWLPRDISHIFS